MHVAFEKTKSCYAIFAVLFLQCLSLTSILTGFRITSAYASSVASRTCLLKPDEGPCRAKIFMYYFDPENGNCKRFPWGGCQGNGNRFSTAEQCYRKCWKNDTSIHTRPRYCSLNFDYGYCFGAVPRYYYDHMWKVCKERIYSGCGGNKNNFYSLEKCEAICRFGQSKHMWQRNKHNKAKGKVLIINPTSATEKRGLDQSASFTPAFTQSEKQVEIIN